MTRGDDRRSDNKIVPLPARDLRSAEAKAWDNFNAARAQMEAEFPYCSDATMLRFIEARRVFFREFLKPRGDGAA